MEEGGGKEALFFVSHPHAAAVALASRQHATSHLEIPYWSTTPYLFGAGRAVKYIARPVSTADDAAARSVDRQLSAGAPGRPSGAGRCAIRLSACSFRPTAGRCRSKTRASNGASTTRRIGASRTFASLPKRSTRRPAGAASCEQLSFNPWHALPDHRPLGDFNRARRDIYRAMAAFRQERRP